MLNAPHLLAVLTAMRMRWCVEGCITQLRTSQASLEATGCCHWASACAALPRRLPWSTMKTKTLTKNYFWLANLQ